MQCHVETFNQVLTQQSLDWDLVALNESEDVQCYLNGETMSATECLATGIRGSHEIVTKSIGGVGLIVKTDKFEVIEGPLVKTLGKWGAERRKALGVLLRVRENGWTFGFWTAHINTNATNWCWRKRQADDLVEAMREGWGSRLPIVAGDFNCSAGSWAGTLGCSAWGLGDEFSLSNEENDRKLCAYLAQRFTEVNGFRNIEQISMLNGRSLELPVGTFVRYKYLAEFGGGNCEGQGTLCSDHPAPYAEVMIPGCIASCEGRECGNDGCGGSCGTCSTSNVCGSQGDRRCFAICRRGRCAPFFPGGCEHMQCGPDGFGGSCGTCGYGRTCVQGRCLAPGQHPL
jgi:hypothetical protein